LLRRETSKNQYAYSRKLQKNQRNERNEHGPIRNLATHLTPRHLGVKTHAVNRVREFARHSE